MTMGARSRAVSLALSCLFAVTATAGDEQGASTERKRAWKPVRFHLETDLELSSTSNLYHLPESEHDALQVKTEPYQRYHGMEGPSDVLTSVSLGLDWTWKHRSKRKIVLSFDSSYTFFSRNSIADQADLGLSVAVDLTKKDHMKLSFDYSPEHFRKNYADEPFIGFRVYSRADQTDSSWRLRYTRDLPSDWKLRFEVSTADRSYAEPFEGRDRELNAWFVEAHRRLNKRVAIDFGLGAGRAKTASSLEFGIEKDRSFDEREATAGVLVKLPRKWRIQTDAGYRTRSYTTDVITDLSRHGREDQRWSVGLEAEKRLAKKWTLALQSSWRRNRSDTLEADPSGDETGYRDFGAGVEISFRH